MIQQELDYLYALSRFGVKPGLAVMQQIMEALGHPERKFKSIHVTGTNGKGSTCAMIESVVREAGYRTALYTSPHLYIFNERIQMNRVPITDAALASLVKEIREVCEDSNIQPTFFEFTTALAFLYFSRSNIDIAVIEVGMGGLYDATNVITPLISVITNVGLDHTEYFGPTKAHVAREKAGIIKEGMPVVTNEKDLEMLKIFEDEAKRKNTRVMRVDDIVNTELISADLAGQEVDVRIGRDASSFRVHLPLLGVHQIENMKTAIAAISILDGVPLTPDNIATGIAYTKWEGRLHILSQKPLIIIDGAHNGDGAQALGTFLQRLHRFDVLVFAAKKGKDISDMLTRVIPLFSHVIVTEGSFMPESAQVLAERIRGIGMHCTIETDPGKAFDAARLLVHDDGTMLVTGSLYMIADVLAHRTKDGV